MSAQPPAKNHPPSPPSSKPPEAWEPLMRLVALARRPLDRFFQIEAASGILLLIAAAIALVWANSSWVESYRHFFHTPLGFHIGPYAFSRPLEWFVNDGLMVIFFIVVGLEIRREIYQGELSDWHRAAVPVLAALGGMAAPAAIYLLFAGAPATRSGWGVPMATDIAFAVGILTLLGKRVPAALRVLLLALAVMDDLGAIVVIALFYSSGLAWSGFFVAALGFGGIFAMQKFGVRLKIAYVAPAILAWAGVYLAGIHPTIAGVMIGLITPVRVWHPIDSAQRESMSPSEALIQILHPWVAFGIMPIFALANAGVAIGGLNLEGSTFLTLLGTSVGLVVGKPLGICLATYFAIKIGLGKLPTSLTLRHIVILGVVAGVGFTMSLFIAQLAFTSQVLLAAAKIGVLLGSATAGIGALVLGLILLAPPPVSPSPTTDPVNSGSPSHPAVQS